MVGEVISRPVVLVVFGKEPCLSCAGLLVVVSSHTSGCSLAFSGQPSNRPYAHKKQR